MGLGMDKCIVAMPGKDDRGSEQDGVEKVFGLRCRSDICEGGREEAEMSKETLSCDADRTVPTSRKESGEKRLPVGTVLHWAEIARL